MYMNPLIESIKNQGFKSREQYKEGTKNILCQIKEQYKDQDTERRVTLSALLVRLYEDLMNNINSAQQPTGAINDDAIEGILAIADTCIEEQNEKKKIQNEEKKKEYKLEDDLKHILKDKEYEKNLEARVNAFYSLCTKYRRIKDYKDFKDLIKIRNDEICKNEIFQIMQAYYYIQETSNDLKPKKALRFWKKEINPKYKRLPAFTQIYTETVVLYCEIEDVKDDALLKEAESLIKDAIDMRKYPKFYSTLGRIFGCMENYDDGLSEVRKAIENEDSNREDYFVRVNEYESIISRLQRKKDEHSLREKAAAIQTQLNRSQKDYIGILGFFSGIMALLIGTFGITAKTPMIDSLQLLMGIAGTIVISFGSLNLLLVRKDEKRNNKYPDWILIIIGLFLFALSFAARVLYKYLETSNWI